MIPDESTPIKNIILTDILAKGKLSYAEMRITLFVIRWSWGFDAGDHRQEWTKDFTISEIAREMNMNYSLCIRTINEMIRHGKLLKDRNRYQFNEHCEMWNITDSSNTVAKNNTLTKSNKGITKSNYILTKSNEPLTKSNGFKPEQNTIETLLNVQIPLSKENIKETNKETIKKIEYALKDKNQDILLRDEKTEKAKELIKEFCRIRNIPLDSGFFSKNIRSARKLVSTYPVEYILAGIEWRLANDSDGFWEEKLWSLNSVYSHFAEWIAQAKLTTGKTFEDWLDQHPEQDYDKINEPDAKLKAFFVAFNRALKDGIVPTEEEWQRYQKARELQREGLRR